MSQKQKVYGVLYLLLGLSLAISISAALICGAVLILLWLIDVIKDKKVSWTSSPLDIPILTYLLWGVLITVIMGSASLRKSISTQSAFFLFFLLAHKSNASQIKRMIFGFCVGSVLVGLLGVMQNFSGIIHFPTSNTFKIPSFFETWPDSVTSLLAVRNGRATGPRSHPLTYAEGFIPAFFLFLTLVLCWKKKKIPLTFYVGGIFICLGILFAQGRAVWLGLILGFFFLGPIIPKKIFISLICAGLLLVGSVLAFSPTYRGRVLSIFQTSQGTQSDQISRSTRFYLWKASVEEIKKRPLFGLGLRGVKLELDPTKMPDNRKWSEAHNIFIQSLLERGAIGFGIFLWVLFVIVRVFWRLPKPWKWTALATFTTFMTAGLTESWMRDKEVALIFWVFVGCAEYLRQHPKELDV